MINKGPELPDVNLVGTTTALFVDYYNENIPDAFPRATLKALLKFQEKFPALFKGKGDWTIEKHRKKLMDWLASYKEEEEGK